ncbi:hypothetical protein WJX72_006769 [[Myrmecia] bisecta]|uniref:EGF-like domain-containing protein n=1 Tax=[Myrmecia] bisecta TaxID=41462 RepID=A0AAW1PPP4_9CHLO
MTQQQLVGKYEVRFTDYRSRQSGFFMLEPDVGPLLPPEDYTTRFETCALVGKQGTLLGSGLGPVIDSHDAVFRMDNCPTTAKHVDNVGLKTTFAVLAEDWAQALLGVEEVGVGPFVHRWWADGGAAVVMWEEASQYSFTQLMNLYPTSNTLLLSRDLVTFTQALAGRLKDGMERHLNASLQVSKVSSLMVAAVLASQICGRVDVYGVLPRCSGRNDYECRRTSYFDDFEPSLAVQDSQELERWLLIHLHQRGLVNLDTPEWVALDANGGLVLGELPHLAQSIGQPGVCDAQQCQPRCSGHGRFEAGACVCAAAFSGPDCSQNRILAHSDAILRGVDMHFDGALLLSQQQVVVDMLSQTYHIPLPQHEAQHRQGGSYLINKEMRHALPANDTWLWEALSTRPQSGTSIAAHLSPRLPNSQATRMQRRTLGRCALVGNAGAQLHHSYGAEIDAHDVVVRFNQGPLRGFEESLGTRTSLEIINKAWMSQLLEGIKSVSPTTRISRHAWDWREPGTALGVYEMFDPASFAFRMSHQIADKEEWWRQAYKKFRRIFPEHPLVALSPHFVVWANQKYAELKAGVQAEGLGSYAGEKPMSGFYAVLLCVQVCEELDVYGFTPYQEADRLDPLAPRYHYFDAAVPRPSSHSFDLADYIYQLLANLTDAIRVFD